MPGHDRRPAIYGATGTRVERIAFRSQSSTDADTEGVPQAAQPVSVVRGAGPPRIIGPPAENDWTVAAGYYLVTLSAVATAAKVPAAFTFELRGAVGDTLLAQGTASILRTKGAPVEVTALARLHLAADTAVNVLVERAARQAVALAAGWTLELAQLGP